MILPKIHPTHTLSAGQLRLILLLLFSILWSPQMNAQTTDVTVTDRIPGQNVRIPDDSRLAEISEMSDYQYDTPVSEPGLWQRLLRWIRDLLTDWVDTIWVQRGLKILGGIAFVIVLLLLIDQVTKGELRNAFTGGGDKAITGDTHLSIPSDGRSMKTLAEEAVAGGDLNLAVRYLYQHSLELLRKRELIQWRPHKTNTEYLLELRGNPVYDPFRQLTRISEFVDYGEFDMDAERYSTFERLTSELERSSEQV